ncbi:hypothetical protein Pmani_013077 [Petrolisthes manimaculis]|uniref:HTH CENPB-type domain-containing protein n=1 Tax=Petrolisthes manimaculis TaxID=1843537 RepID=A0AAE1UEG4_9EUCA|nr:hypothetical protein Pmani_013077 [Petrolisthes manimaculis]
MSSPAPKSRKGIKLKILSLEDKLRLLLRVDAGASKQEICDEFEVKPTTFYDIQRNKDKIRSHAHTLEELGVTLQKKMKHSKYTTLDGAVLRWYSRQQRERTHTSLPIRGVDIQKAAMKFAKLLKIEGFCASAKWLINFLGRHSIINHKVVVNIDKSVSAEPAAAVESDPFTHKLNEDSSTSTPAGLINPSHEKVICEEEVTEMDFEYDLRAQNNLVSRSASTSPIPSNDEQDRTFLLDNNGYYMVENMEPSNEPSDPSPPREDPLAPVDPLALPPETIGGVKISQYSSDSLTSSEEKLTIVDESPKLFNKLTGDSYTPRPHSRKKSAKTLVNASSTPLTTSGSQPQIIWNHHHTVTKETSALSQTVPVSTSYSVRGHSVLLNSGPNNCDDFTKSLPTPPSSVPLPTSPMHSPSSAYEGPIIIDVGTVPHDFFPTSSPPPPPPPPTSSSLSPLPPTSLSHSIPTPLTTSSLPTYSYADTDFSMPAPSDGPYLPFISPDYLPTVSSTPLRLPSLSTLFSTSKTLPETLLSSSPYSSPVPHSTPFDLTAPGSSRMAEPHSSSSLHHTSVHTYSKFKSKMSSRPRPIDLTPTNPSRTEQISFPTSQHCLATLISKYQSGKFIRSQTQPSSSYVLNPQPESSSSTSFPSTFLSTHSTSTPTASTSRLAHSSSTPSASTSRLAHSSSTPSASTSRLAHSTSTPSASTSRLAHSTSTASASTSRLAHSTSTASASTSHLKPSRSVLLSPSDLPVPPEHRKKQRLCSSPQKRSNEKSKKCDKHCNPTSRAKQKESTIEQQTQKVIPSECWNMSPPAEKKCFIIERQEALRKLWKKQNLLLDMQIEATQVQLAVYRRKLFMAETLLQNINQRNGL